MRRVVLAGVVLALCVACGGGEDPTVSSAEPSASADPTPAPTPCVLEDADTEPKSAKLGEDVAQVTDMRWDDDERCPRVVFEFRDQISTYDVRYRDDVSECGSDMSPSVDGWGASAFLVVKLQPAGGPDPLSEDGEPVYKGPRDINVDGPVLKHIKVTCDYEAEFTWVIALDDEHPFNVTTMSDPARLVVDISQG